MSHRGIDKGRRKVFSWTCNSGRNPSRGGKEWRCLSLGKISFDGSGETAVAVVVHGLDFQQIQGGQQIMVLVSHGQAVGIYQPERCPRRAGPPVQVGQSFLE